MAVLALFVNPVRRAALPASGFRAALVHDVLRSGPLRRLALAATMLGLLTIGDAFIFLGYRRVADIRLEFFPLLFTGMSLVYLLLAVPVGRLADRIGRAVVLLAGYAVLGLVYVVLLDPPPGVLGLVAVIGGLGLFYAATDGVLMAAASELLGPRARATGLAVVATGTAVGRFGASLLFGLVWTRYGPETAFAWFAVAMPVAVLVSWRLTAPRGPGPGRDRRRPGSAPVPRHERRAAGARRGSGPMTDQDVEGRAGAPRVSTGLRIGIFAGVCILAVVIAGAALYVARRDR